MKRAKGVLANVLTVLFTLSAFLLAGFIAVIVPATSNSFYKAQFRKHGTLEKVRAQSAYIDDADAKNYVANMTEEQLLSLMNHTMRYCLYLEDDLNIEKDGKRLEIFLDERGEPLDSGCLEVTHMSDVKKLFGAGVIICIVAAVVFVTTLILGLIFKKEYYLYCRKTVFVTLGACLAVLAVIGVTAAINFDFAFTLFHEIFFSGKQWRFGYGVMINMIGEIFTGIVPIIAAIWIVLLVITVAGAALFNKKISSPKNAPPRP